MKVVKSVVLWMGVWCRFKTVIFSLLICSGLSAQDLEPRSTSAAPTKTNFAFTAYSFSTGNIVLDNSIPVEDLTSDGHIISAGYLRTFGLFNKIWKADVIMPLAFTRFEGKVNERDSSTNKNGFGDALMGLSVILVGEEALTPREFAVRDIKKFSWSANLKVRLPTGKYEDDKLLNLGANRWAFRVGTGVSYRITPKFIVEAIANLWLFTSNKDFLEISTFDQDPILNSQFHFSYSFRPGFWLAASIGSTRFGSTTVDGDDKDNGQRNSRFGFALAYPIGKSHGLKLVFTDGITQRSGSDFQALTLAYQYRWFDRPRAN